MSGHSLVKYMCGMASDSQLRRIKKEYEMKLMLEREGTIHATLICDYLDIIDEEISRRKNK